MSWLVLALLLQGPLPQAPVRDATPVAPGSATLTGRVTDKATGLPLAGIIVRIPSSKGALDARTDTDGVYRIRRVPAGSHMLVALMPDYRATHLPQVYGDTAPPSADWTTGTPVRINVEPGETYADLDFALVRAMGISGRVIDNAGEPMSGVRVRVEPVRSNAVVRAFSRDTDDRGEFRVFGLAPGRYRVCADPARFGYTDVPPDAPATACVPPDGRDDGALVIGATEPAPVQIQMRRGGTVSISGTVVDAGGVLAEGATVTLGRHGNRTPMPSTYAVPIWPGARFVARGVSPGEYFIAASGGRAVDNGQIERQYAYVPITVGTDDLTGVVIALTPPVDLTGRLIVDGDPVPPGRRLTVQALPRSRIASVFNRAVPTGVVRDDMTFDLAGVLGSTYIACSGLPDGWAVKTVRYGGADVTDAVFTPSADVTAVEVVLTSRGAIVSGTVANSGAAERPVMVVIFPAGEPGARAEDSSRHLALVRPDGTFRLDAVRAGEYYVAALVTSPWTSTPTLSMWERLARVAERVTLGEGDRRTIDLRIVKVPEER